MYSVKLTRLEHNGAATDAVIRVTVDNLSPTVTLATPQPGEVFIVGKDEWIDVKAQVQDDNTISRVEFYANDPAAPFAVKTVAPFNVKWTIPLGAGGSVELWAVAVDGAGNRTESQHVPVVLSYQ